MLRKAKKRRDSGTRSKVSKKPWQSKAHRDRMTRWGCLIAMRATIAPPIRCGGVAIEAHHCRKLLGRGEKLPRDDRYCAPLCTWHHNELHEGKNGPENERAFWKRYGIDPAAWIASFSPEGRAALEALQPRREG